MFVIWRTTEAADKWGGCFPENVEPYYINKEITLVQETLFKKYAQATPLNQRRAWN